jgi:KaiC/GvpD/RAD55 family RecA-like ATPase
MDVVNRIPSGIDGLDQLIEGGLPISRTFLVSGATGAGKTIFSMQYLYNGAKKYGENGVYVTLDERPELIRQDMAKFGWDIKQLEDERKLLILDASVTRIGLSSDEEHAMTDLQFDYKKLLLNIVRSVKEIGAKRVVIDSIATLGMYFKTEEEVRAIVLEMVYVLSRIGVTTLLVSELEVDTKRHSKYGVEEFVADGVFILKYLDTGVQGINRTLLIRKMRATKHSSDIHPVEITAKGMIIKNIDDYNL